MRIWITLLLAGALSAQVLPIKHRRVVISQAGIPVFSPSSQTFSGTQSFTISSTGTTGCNPYIYYGTTSTPTTGDTHSASGSVSSTTTLYAKVIGCPGYSDSSVGTVTYTVGAAPITVNPAHKITKGGSSGNTMTTSAVDLTGDNGAFVALGGYATAMKTMTVVAIDGSSVSHSCTVVSTLGSAQTQDTALFYCPITGGAGFTFRASGTGLDGSFPGMAVIGVANLAAVGSGPDAFNSSGNSTPCATGGTCASGQITSLSSSIIITTFTSSDTSTISATPTDGTSHFTYTLGAASTFSSGVVPVAIAYSIQGSGNTTNPTWTGTTPSSAVVASFH